MNTALGAYPSVVPFKPASLLGLQMEEFDNNNLNLESEFNYLRPVLNVIRLFTSVVY